MAFTSTLQELLLVEHFRTPLPLSILDMADWANEFATYPKAQQLQVVPPVELSSPGPIGFTFNLAQPELPRLMLRSANGERTIQLQADRFGYGWSRKVPIGERAEYPGFEAIKLDCATEMHKFRTWCGRRIGTVPKIKLVEIGYHNAAPIVVGEKRRRLADIFRWVQPARPVNSFQVSWAELLQKDRPDAPRVNAVVAVGSAPPVAEALIFNFMGFAPIDKDDDGNISDAFDRLHQRILEMYESAIVKDGGDEK
ncbi:MAG: TIGR04255 family protein [Roseiarcus sp.]